MADKAASVLARLKNKSIESGRSYQLCLQLFCQEEFLRRLEKSKYVDNFVLKGGLFIYTLTEFESRVTMDIDLLLQKLPNTPEELKPIILDISLSRKRMVPPLISWHPVGNTGSRSIISKYWIRTVPSTRKRDL